MLPFWGACPVSCFFSFLLKSSEQPLIVLGQLSPRHRLQLFQEISLWLCKRHVSTNVLLSASLYPYS